MTESSHKATVWVGIITFGALTAPYLSFFEKSLEQQSYKDFKLVVHDNTHDNIGFSQAYNFLIKKAREAGAQYFLVINPDLILEPDCLERLVGALETNKELASVAPKLYRWDFQHNQKTKIIDSCGLVMAKGLWFFDLGQTEIDQGQYDKASIIGPSGAAALYRISALEKVAEDGQYFDEHFFMYKEDCDLAYRLKLAGFFSKLVPQAIAYHDRSASGGSLWQRFWQRRTRSQNIKRWAFINQHLLFIKYWRQQNIMNYFMIIVRKVMMFVNALLLEQYLLPCYKTILSQAKTIKRY